MVAILFVKSFILARRECDALPKSIDISSRELYLFASSITSPYPLGSWSETCDLDFADISKVLERTGTRSGLWSIVCFCESLQLVACLNGATLLVVVHQPQQKHCPPNPSAPLGSPFWVTTSQWLGNRRAQHRILKIWWPCEISLYFNRLCCSTCC